MLQNRFFQHAACNVRHRALLWFCVLAPAWVAAQTTPPADTLLVKRATELRSGPAESQPSLAPLAAQTTVTRLTGRQGPWIEVRTAAGATGWLHMFDVTGTTGNTGNVATGALRSIGSFFNRPNSPQANTGGATATIGIRGLSAEDLARSQPNLSAVAQMETLRQDGKQARSFGTEAQLTAQTVAALPVPPAPTAASSETPQR